MDNADDKTQYMPKHANEPFPKRFNPYAVVSLCFGVLWVLGIGSLIAVIFGHMALRALASGTCERGRGVAIAGLVLGYLGVGTYAFFFLPMMTAELLKL